MITSVASKGADTITIFYEDEGNTQEGGADVSFGSAAHSEGESTYSLGDYSHAEELRICSIGTHTHSE